MANPKPKDKEPAPDTSAQVPASESAPPDNVAQFKSAADAAKARISAEEQAALDEAERLADDAILDDEEGDAPGDKDEILRPLIEKKPPRFGIFRANPVTFDLWGTSDREGMDERIFLTTKSFAPNFEEDVELKRIRFFETVTTDGVIRLIWAVVPEKRSREANTWHSSKLAALEMAQTQWTTMRSRTKQQQYSFRPSRKQEEYGHPKFSGRTPRQWIAELKKLGMLIDSKDHEFYKKATDSE